MQLRKNHGPWNPAHDLWPPMVGNSEDGTQCVCRPVAVTGLGRGWPDPGPGQQHASSPAPHGPSLLLVSLPQAPTRVHVGVLPPAGLSARRPNGRFVAAGPSSCSPCVLCCDRVVSVLFLALWCFARWPARRVRLPLGGRLCLETAFWGEPLLCFVLLLGFFCRRNQDCF